MLGNRSEAERNKLLIIILFVLAVLIIVFGVIFSLAQNNKRDWESMKIEEEAEQVAADYPFNDGKVAKEGFGDIKSIVLRNTSDTMQDRYTYEISVGKDGTYFSCLYYVDGEKVAVENETINASRLTDITDIIDRYTVATTIRNYRNDPESVQITSDDEQALEITWADGDFLNVGFPNGAGPALKKYFIGLAEWIGSTKAEQ